MPDLFVAVIFSIVVLIVPIFSKYMTTESKTNNLKKKIKKKLDKNGYDEI